MSSVLAPISLLVIPKKHQFVLSAFLGGLGMLVVACYSHLRDAYGADTHPFDRLGWVPLVGALVTSVAHGFGLLPVLHIILNEIFPTDIRYTKVFH